MANVSYYLEALMMFDEPVSAREVHQKATEMFGDSVRGDRSSCRMSLDRYVSTGKVEKRDNRYYATQLAVDPIGALTTKMRIAQAENAALRKRVKELETEVAELKSQSASGAAK